MSASGVNYHMMEAFGSNERLAAYFNFNQNYTGDAYSGLRYLTDMLPSSAERSSGEVLTGVALNRWPAYNVNEYSGILMSAASSSEGTVTSSLTGIFAQDKLDLGLTNIEFNTTDLNLNNMAIFMDFEFKGDIENSILFGAFEKSEEEANGEYFTGSKGFNVGVTDRGHLFLQCFGARNDQISVLNSELTKRNLIGISSFGSSITLSSYDFIRDSIDTIEVPTTSSYIADTEKFYIGGSNQYFRGSGPSDLTATGIYLNGLAIFSGAVTEDFMYSIGSGFLGEYTFTSATETTSERVTGFSEVLVYKTGILGYEYYTTGQLTIATGREYVSGVSFSSSSSESVNEGDRYYKYYTLKGVGLGNDEEITYREEVGFLNSGDGFFYAPIGTEAQDTLGLRDAADSIQNYVMTNFTGQKGVNIDLKGKRPVTGTLNEVSGVSQVALTEEFTVLLEGVSGIDLTGQIQDFRKNYIYYLGERI